MTNLELVKTALRIATKEKTVYLWGTFGSPLTAGLISQKAKQYPSRYSAARQTLLKGKVAQSPWAFDCVGLIKGILWGWSANPSKSFGGAVYQGNQVPDIGAGTMANRTLERSTDLKQILPGEVVYKSGHIGIYVGDGKVVEATLTEKYDGVVITDLEKGNWTGHGKLPWITYETQPAPKPEAPPITVGSAVRFSGGTHYTSANGNKGYPASAGPATVTRIVTGTKHPYHLIHTDKTSNVYGWVDEDTVTGI